ncbi:Abc transporter g family member 17-like [Thalictrum thalictroides]|uniref:Abc transporter g family member 17-like n=1 Tax=Thalictrum thalictroides TaxID=46969 RepID=A0A7J6VJE2_THATH|nr:Abc transporter g family member 17-like [Thalictrum thalictroides]
MAQLGHLEKNRSLESLLDMDKSVVSNQQNLLANSSSKMLQGQGLEFENLSYSVMKKQKKDGVWFTKEAFLLHDISGQAKRGEIMAIMGDQVEQESQHFLML